MKTYICLQNIKHLSFAFIVAFLPLSQAGYANEILLPDRGHFEYNNGIAVAFDGTTAIVANDLDQSLYVYEQNSNNTFSRESVITPDIADDAYFGFTELRGDTLVVWTQSTDYNSELETITRNNSGQWIQDSSVIQDANLFRGFRLSTDGKRLIVVKRDDTVELYKRSANTWVIELSATPVNWSYAENSFCIGDNIAIAGLSMYQLDDNNPWRDLGPKELEQGSITVSSSGRYLFSNSYTRPTYSSDCMHAVVRAKDEQSYSAHIFSLNHSYQWTRDSAFYNKGYFHQADINSQYAVVRQLYDPNVLTVYRNNGNRNWAELGNLHTTASHTFFGNDFTLSGSTLIASNLAPGLAETFDLRNYDFQSSPTRICGIGFSDQNNNGFGLEQNATCVIPESEFSIGDSRRDTYISVERTYSGPTVTAALDTEGSFGVVATPDNPRILIDNPVAISGNRAAKVFSSEEDQLMVEFYVNANNQWLLESAVDIVPLIRPESLVYPVDLRFSANNVRINLDGDIMALALRAVTPDFLGAVYTFERCDSTGWQFTGEITRPQIGVWIEYAGSVALSGDELAVRSGDLGGEGGAGPGVVHMYRKQDSGGWQRYTDIVDVRNVGPGTPFGKSLALKDDKLLVASEKHTDVYERQANGSWEAQQVLFAGDGTGNHQEVHLSDNTALILDQGKLYSFTPDSSGYLTPDAIFTGGDLIIHSGGVWSADVNPATVTTDTMALFPVAFAASDTNQPIDNNAPDNTDPTDPASLEEANSSICTDTDGDGWDGTEHRPA